MGIDIGSTSIKAVIYNENLQIVATGRRTTPLVEREKKGKATEYFWDPLRMWENVAAAVREALSGIDRPHDIGGVAVDGFGSDAVPVASDGEILYPFISWHDRKTVEQLNRFKRLISEERLYRITGTRPWYFHTLFKSMWLKEHMPEVYARTSKFLIITDYINYRLCGAMVTDFSEASTTLGFDQKTLTWSEEIFHLAEIDVSLYPETLQAGTKIGTVTENASKETGLCAGTPVVLGGHDNICSFIAGRNVDLLLPVIVTGTFESVLFPSSLPVLDTRSMQRNIVCEKSMASEEYILWGAHHACDMIEWFMKCFNMEANVPDGSHESCEDMYHVLSERGVGARGVFLLPHLLGSIAPVDDPKSRGVFIGFTEKTEKLDLLRAIIEGINFQSRSICEAVSSVTGTNISRTVNIGGAANSDFWMQNRADITGMVIEVPEVKEATSLGVAILAGIGVGLFPSYRQALLRRGLKTRTYVPQEERFRKYDRLYTDIFLKLYESTRDINHRISAEFS